MLKLNILKSKKKILFNSAETAISSPPAVIPNLAVTSSIGAQFSSYVKSIYFSICCFHYGQVCKCCKCQQFFLWNRRGINTLYPRIVSAETILFEVNLKYIQVRKLFAEIRHEVFLTQHYTPMISRVFLVQLCCRIFNIMNIFAKSNWFTIFKIIAKNLVVYYIHWMNKFLCFYVQGLVLVLVL